MEAIKLKKLVSNRSSMIEGRLNADISIGDKFKVLSDVYLHKLPQYSKKSWNNLGFFKDTFKNSPVLPKGATFEIDRELFSDLTGGTYELIFLDSGIIVAIMFKRMALEHCIDSGFVKKI